MKKSSKYFREIELLKERQRLRIIQQELKIKSNFRELSDNLTGITLINRVKDNLFSGSGLAFKLGFMAVSLLTDRLKRKRKK
jgi:hypothetical protein